MIPALDLIRDSARSRGLPMDIVGMWSMPWLKLAEAVFPQILGRVVFAGKSWYWGGRLYPGHWSPFILSIYCGVLIMPLCLAGALARIRGRRFVMMVVAFSVAIAAGNHTPLLRLLHAAGVATMLRYPEKFILLGLFSSVVFAACVMERVREDEGLRKSVRRILVVLVLIGVTMTLVAQTAVYARSFGRLFGVEGVTAALSVRLSTRDWMLATLRCLAGLLILHRQWNRRHLQSAILIAFVFCDLLLAARYVCPRIESRFYDPPPAANWLRKEASGFRLFHEAHWLYTAGEATALFRKGGEAQDWVLQNGIFPMTPSAYGIATVMDLDYDLTALLPTVDFMQSAMELRRSFADWYSPLMAMSNARYRALFRSEEELHGRTDLETIRHFVPIVLWEETAVPRYYFSDQVVTIRDRSDFVRALSERQYSKRVAFIEHPLGVSGTGRVTHVEETANTARIEVLCSQPSFLVMSVTPHKYWSVYLDGHPITTVRTNIGYQGTAVPPGSHVITMRYRNTTILWSAAVSALFLMAAIVAAIKSIGPARTPL
jgi:hypothetical protein